MAGHRQGDGTITIIRAGRARIFLHAARLRSVSNACSDRPMCFLDMTLVKRMFTDADSRDGAHL